MVDHENTGAAPPTADDTSEHTAVGRALAVFAANATFEQLAAMGQMIVDELDAAPWDCEAYGPGSANVGALCFVAPELGERVCENFRHCAATMRAARQELFDRIHQRAAEGDETSMYLAEEFTDPGQLLGGTIPDAVDMLGHHPPDDATALAAYALSRPIRLSCRYPECECDNDYPCGPRDVDR